MPQPSAQPVHVKLVLHADAQAGARELEQATSKLRRELLRLDVEAVDRAPAGPAPEGTRAVDIAEIGTLLVTISTAAGGLAPLVLAVQAWLSARGSGSVTMQVGTDKSITVSGRLTADQRQLVDTWTKAIEPQR